jgi:hypothetical protein
VPVTAFYRFPDVCSRCATLPASEKWAISGYTSKINVVVYRSGVVHWIDLPVCRNCRSELEQAQKKPGRVGLALVAIAFSGTTLFFSLSGSLAIAITIGLVVGIPIGLLAAALVVPIVSVSTNKPIARFDNEGRTIHFANANYQAMFERLNASRRRTSP